MPIYAYRCTSCGFEKDVMQKVSEPKLTTCPQCATENFTKQLTAPGFQLKGTGWYATDFKGGGNAKAAAAKADSKSDSKAESKTDSAASASKPESNGVGAPRSGNPAMQSTPAPTGASTTTAGTPSAAPSPPPTGS